MNFETSSLVLFVIVLTKAEPPPSSLGDNGPPSSYFDHSNQGYGTGMPLHNSGYGYGYNNGNGMISPMYDYTKPSSHFNSYDYNTLSSSPYGQSPAYNNPSSASGYNSPSNSYDYNHYTSSAKDYAYNSSPETQSDYYGYHKPSYEYQNSNTYSLPSQYGNLDTNNYPTSPASSSSPHSPFRTFYESESPHNTFRENARPFSDNFHNHSPSSDNNNLQLYNNYYKTGGQDYDFDLSKYRIHENTFSNADDASYESYYKTHATAITIPPPSYVPPRSLLESMFHGIKSSIAAKLKPAFGFDEPWKPVQLQNEQSNPHHHHDTDSTRSEGNSKHIYIHSSTNNFPEEVNLKLILIKPKSNDGNHYGLAERQLGSVSSTAPLFPISDSKRSKINAQLYFVRFKSPLKTRLDASKSILAKPIYHFLSKRISELEKNKDKKS